MTYRIEARNADSATEDGASASSLVSFYTVQSRAGAAEAARTFHSTGYWSEVLCGDTGESLAGPFDPGLDLPAYVF